MRQFSNHSAASFTLKYQIINKNTEAIIALGETSHVFVNKKNRPARIPEEFMEKFIKE